MAGSAVRWVPMSIRRSAAALALSLATLLAAGSASAACMNKFVSRPEGNKQVITLLPSLMSLGTLRESGCSRY